MTSKISMFGFVKAACVLLLCLLLQSCVHVPEFTSNYDIVFGDEYKPSVKVLSKEPTGRTLLVIVQNQVNPAYLSIFLQKFKDTFTAFDLVLPTQMKTYVQPPTRTEIDRLAAENQCESVMLLKIAHPSVYQPIRVTMDVVVERLQDNLTIFKGNSDYDARNEFVANSARRYFQLILRRQNTPDKSLSILRTNPDFFEFSGWHFAKFLNYLSSPPIKDLNKDIHDPKNIQDFEPTETPSAPKPVKKPATTPADKDKQAPSSNKSIDNKNSSPSTPSISPTSSKTASSKTGGSSALSSPQPEESENSEPIAQAIPVSDNSAQKFEEPPATIQKQRDLKPIEDQDRLKSEENEGSSSSGRSGWLKNR